VRRAQSCYFSFGATAFGLLASAFLAALIATVAIEDAQARSTQKLTTPGGVSIWLVEDHGIPLVALSFAMRGGSALDPAGKAGAADLFASMLNEGAGDLDAEAFKRQLESFGSKLSFSVSHAALTGSLVSLTKHLQPSADLLKLALERPRLDPDAFEQARRQALLSLNVSATRPKRLAVDQFYEIAFSGHPYATPATGTKDSIGRLTIDDIRARKEALIGKTGLHVVIVGDLDAAAAMTLVDHVFKDLPEGSKPATIPAKKPKPFVKTVPAIPGQQEATAVFSLPMPPLGDADFFPAMALNYIVGSGNFDARLTEEVRVERGLTYSISSQFVADRASSLTIGAVSTEPGKMDETRSVIKSVYADLKTNGPTQKELDNARTGLNGSYLLSLDTSWKLANNMLGLWIDDLDADYIEKRRAGLNAVTMEKARETAQRYFDPDALSLLIARPK